MRGGSAGRVTHKRTTPFPLPHVWGLSSFLCSHGSNGTAHPSAAYRRVRFTGICLLTACSAMRPAEAGMDRDVWRMQDRRTCPEPGIADESATAFANVVNSSFSIGMPSVRADMHGSFEPCPNSFTGFLLVAGKRGPENQPPLDLFGRFGYHSNQEHATLIC
jgi:hypothetical protein